jgi:hypothetical protein
MSRGIEIFSEETMDNLEEVLATACDADDATVAATTFIKASIAGATSGGIILTAADLQALVWMLDLVKTRSAAARAAAEALHNWIHE